MYPRFSSPRGFSPPFANRGPSPGAGQHRFNGPSPQHSLGSPHNQQTYRPPQRFHHPPPSPDYRGPRPSHPLSPTHDRGAPAFPPVEQHTPPPGFSPHGPPHRGHFPGYPGTGYTPRGPHGPPGNHTPPPGPGRGGFGPERGGRGGPQFGRGGGFRGAAGGGHRGGGHPTEGHRGGGHPTEGHRGGGHPTEGHQTGGHHGGGHPTEHRGGGHQTGGHRGGGHLTEGHRGGGHPTGGHRGGGHQTEHRGGGHPTGGHRGGGHPTEHRGGGHRGRGGGHQTGGHGFHPGQGGDGHGQGFKRNHNGPNGPAPQKKQKIEKRDTAENNVHFCDICDRGFKTDEKFKEHTDQHTKCSVEGCNYIAAPKLVKLHYQWQHLTGFAKKIWAPIESPEDIKKWRQERRNQFPTAANKAKKEAIQEGKIQRGEVLETKFFGKTRGRGRGQGRGRGRGRGRRGRWDEPEEEIGITAPDTEVKDKNEQAIVIDTAKEAGPAEQDGMSIPAGQDPLSLLITNTKEDAELGDGAENTTTKTESTLPAGLRLLSSYADLSDSDKEEEPKEESSKAASTEGKPEAPLVTEMDTEMPPPTESVSGRGGRGGRRGRRRDRGKNKNKQQNNKPIRRGPSLLEKLLAPEIRHERNVLLQCVRYIVRNNFFGIGVEMETTEKAETETVTSDVADVEITKPMDEATTL